MTVGGVHERLQRTTRAYRDIRQFGPLGPVYEIIDVARSAQQEPRMRIRVIESGEELDYPLSNILEDPKEV
jgi:hypothetical protein